jgi:hypothetical protein
MFRHLQKKASSLAIYNCQQGIWHKNATFIRFFEEEKKESEINENQLIPTLISILLQQYIEFIPNYRQ